VLLAFSAKFCDDWRMSTDLDTEVRALLEQRRGEWKRIALSAGVSHSWISQFVRRKIPNPGYATLRDLKVQLTPEVPMLKRTLRCKVAPAQSAADSKEAA
jgi:hypothetical protein